MNDVALSELAPYLLVMAGLVLCSSFFSGTEVAMFSLRRVNREQLLRSGNRRDALAVRLVSRPSRLIATLLIGNESVNVSFSALMAGVCTRLFHGHVGEAELAVLAVALSLPGILVFGEITPKTVAIRKPLEWARRAAVPLWFFEMAVTPIRLVVRTISDLVVRVLGLSARKAASRDLSEAEFKALVDAGSAEGEVDPRERRLIHKVFEFGDKTVADVMVPRPRVFALSYDLPVARLSEQIAERGFSRVPIYHKSLDNVRGILYAKDLLIQASGVGGAPRKLMELLHEPLFVVQTMPLKRLFRIFKQRHIHLALVVNEYGKVSGLVTLEDLLEEIFGELRDESSFGDAAAVSGDARAELPSDATPTPTPIPSSPAEERQ